MCQLSCCGGLYAVCSREGNTVTNVDHSMLFGCCSKHGGHVKHTAGVSALSGYSLLRCCSAPAKTACLLRHMAASYALYTCTYAELLRALHVFVCFTFLPPPWVFSGCVLRRWCNLSGSLSSARLSHVCGRVLLSVFMVHTPVRLALLVPGGHGVCSVIGSCVCLRLLCVGD
jgi:hypothetical protein